MPDADLDPKDSLIKQMEEQLRFFKSAYGITASSPAETYTAGLRVLDHCHLQGEALHNDAQRLMRASIEVARKLEAAERHAKGLHDTLVNLSLAVANALDLARSTTGAEPPWLYSLAVNLDLVLADAALHGRPTQ